ncbi:MAG: hypothetical protein MJD61_21210 [Proteobacteria bacterium]|nr:hypothetical protein [Pseudomonadota bacterium]
MTHPIKKPKSASPYFDRRVPGASCPGRTPRAAPCLGAALRVALLCCLVLVGACVGRLDGDHCSFFPGTYFPSFFVLDGDCPPHADYGKLELDLGDTIQQSLGRNVAITTVGRQGCRISVKHKMTMVEDEFEGDFIPVGGGEFLEGTVVRRARLPAKVCTSTYFVVLTQEARVASLIGRTGTADTAAP